MKSLKAKNLYSVTVSIIAAAATVLSFIILTKELFAESRIQVILIGLLGSLIGAVVSFFLSNLVARRRQPRVFISYSQEDKKTADFLKEKLKSYGIAIKSGDDILRVGDNLVDQLKQGISESDYVILLLSRNSNQSSWLTREMSFSLEEGKKIFPVLVEDTELPEQLSGIMFADLRKDAEAGAEFLVRSLLENAQSKRVLRGVA